MSVEMFVFLIEIVGTVAFASSGAMVGIRRNMDVFGVIVMAITTAVGGGVIRDLVLGVHVPTTFRNPVYVSFAVGTALVLFTVFYLRSHMLESTWMGYYERLMSVMDAIGLGAFTVIGVQTAYQLGYSNKIFLQLFVGVITGVGGGVIRDMMAMQTPFIFVKHVYACASLIGALVCVLLMPYNKQMAMTLGAAIIVIIRILAAKYRWNLPKIRIEKPADQQDK